MDIDNGYTDTILLQHDSFSGKHPHKRSSDDESSKTIEREEVVYVWDKKILRGSRVSVLTKLLVDRNWMTELKQNITRVGGWRVCLLISPMKGRNGKVTL